MPRVPRRFEPLLECNTRRPPPGFEQPFCFRVRASRKQSTACAAVARTVSNTWAVCRLAEERCVDAKARLCLPKIPVAKHMVAADAAHRNDARCAATLRVVGASARACAPCCAVSRVAQIISLDPQRAGWGRQRGEVLDWRRVVAKRAHRLDSTSVLLGIEGGGPQNGTGCMPNRARDLFIFSRPNDRSCLRFARNRQIYSARPTHLPA